MTARMSGLGCTHFPNNTGSQCTTQTPFYLDPHSFMLSTAVFIYPGLFLTLVGLCDVMYKIDYKLRNIHREFKLFIDSSILCAHCSFRGQEAALFAPLAIKGWRHTGSG